MKWDVLAHEAFADEFRALKPEVRRGLSMLIGLLEQFGPHLRRPYADTLNGSRYANMKELRFDAGDGVWRVAYAFDPARTGILLLAGTNQDRAAHDFTGS